MRSNEKPITDIVRANSSCDWMGFL